MNAIRTTILAAAILAACAGPITAQEREATHTVQAGETLYSIAHRYGLDVAELQRINGIEGTIIRVGQVLLVTAPEAVPDPVEPESPTSEPVPDRPSAPAPKPAAAGPGRIAVDESLSLFEVAHRLGASPDTLLALNPDLPVVFAAGDTLTVPAGFAAVTVEVRPGDTLFGLASRHGTTVAAIRAANELSSDRIRVGQKLRIPTGGSLPASADGPTDGAEGLWTEYPDRFEGRLMASGRPYDPGEFTIAHSALELGAVVLVTSPKTGRSVFAEVADRMPGRDGYVAEVSSAVAAVLGRPDGPLRVRVIDRPPVEEGS